MEKMDYKGKLAVITGASSGIGLELARVFGENGFDLLIVAEDDGIERVCNSMKREGCQVDFVKTDLSTYEGVEKLHDKIKACGKPLHSICMNAGIGVSGEFINTDLEKEIKLIDLNIVSLVHLSKCLLPDMVARGQGNILFTSSIVAEMPGPYYAVYAASKTFVQSFVEALRFEVKDKGIVITANQPGATDTNFFARAEMLDTPAGKKEKDDPSIVAKDGFRALMAGDDYVVAGSFNNKIQKLAERIMPETLQAKIHSMDTKPDSLKK